MATGVIIPAFPVRKRRRRGARRLPVSGGRGAAGFAPRPDGPGSASWAVPCSSKGSHPPPLGRGVTPCATGLPQGWRVWVSGVWTCNRWTWGSAPLAYCARAPPPPILGDLGGTLYPVRSPDWRTNPIAFQTLASPRKPPCDRTARPPVASLPLPSNHPGQTGRGTEDPFHRRRAGLALPGLGNPSPCAFCSVLCVCTPPRSPP